MKKIDKGFILPSAAYTLIPVFNSVEPDINSWGEILLNPSKFCRKKERKCQRGESLISNCIVPISAK